MCAGKLKISNRKKTELLAELVKLGYETFQKEEKADKSNENTQDSDDESDEEDNVSDSQLSKGYEYLLGMKLWNLTREKVDKLQADRNQKAAEVEELSATAPHSLWWRDLDELEDAIAERDVEIEACLEEERKAQAASKKTQAKKNKKAAKKTKKKKAGWDSDESDSEDEAPMYDDFSDDEIVYTKKSKKTSKAKVVKTDRAPAPAAAPVIHEVLEGVSYFSEKSRKAPATAAKADSIVDEIPLEELSLADRMKAKTASKKSAKAPAAKKAPAAAKIAPAKGKGMKVAKVVESEDEEEFGSDDESEDEVAVAPAPRARAGRARKAIDYKAMAQEEENDDSEDDAGSESDFSEDEY